MPDEATPTTPAASPETPAPPVEETKTVPYERFAEVNNKAKAEREAREDLERRLQELEDRDKSELERERAQRERLSAELEEKQRHLVKVERGSWVRDAAVEAKFIDPTDALGRVSLDAIESESDARKAVKRIAEQAKHLIQQEAPVAPQIGQVVAGGQPVNPNAPDPKQDENERFLAELKEASSRGWSQSSTGLLD
jgi:hypothetical protein